MIASGRRDIDALSSAVNEWVVPLLVKKFLSAYRAGLLRPVAQPPAEDTSLPQRQSPVPLIQTIQKRVHAAGGTRQKQNCSDAENFDFLTMDRR
jgi:hypothetical protein